MLTLTLIAARHELVAAASSNVQWMLALLILVELTVEFGLAVMATSPRNEYR